MKHSRKKLLAEFQKAEKALPLHLLQHTNPSLHTMLRLKNLWKLCRENLEIDAFEAQLEAELAAQEIMAEIIAEEERAKRLAEFQAKVEAEKAAAAASTAAYQSQA